MPRESAGSLTVNQDATSKLLIKTASQMAVNSNNIFQMPREFQIQKVIKKMQVTAEVH